jgi:formylmethanofuran:tetrahydromethanopterin formyltransferase
MSHTIEEPFHYSKAMPESVALRAARRSLAAAEAALEVQAGLEALAEGLSLLDGIAAAGSAVEVRTARNLAASYASRIYGRVADRVASDAQVPEPLLEHYFRVVLAFDAIADALPADAAALKISVVRALIERYYEGHPPEAKRRALAQLATVGGGGEPAPPERSRR